MKKIRSLFSLLAIASMAVVFNSCTPEGSGPGPEPIPVADHHFDIFMTVGKHGGMNQGEGTIVKSVDALTADQPTIDIRNDGVEFRSADNVYSMEAIVGGQYYYQVPNSGDRFTKLQVVGNSVKIVQEQPFVKNTFKVRGYTHAWLDDKTLLIMSANGPADKIIWTKLNADDMRILAEGTLELPLPQGATVFNASGILTYNDKAGKLYYFYFGKDKTGRNGVPTSKFLVAVINPSTMAVESNKVNILADEMAGSAYGELMQNCVMYDEAGNLYLAAFSDTEDIEKGQMLRMTKGATDFDAAYEGFPNADGKLLTIQYLGVGKALIYSRNDAKGTAIDAYAHYYSIVDLATGKRERLKYNGTEIPYSGGRFAQRTAVVDGKAYIGVNTEAANPCIYIYDIATGKVEKGVEISEGYYFDMLRVVTNTTPAK
jgi:hypothetical protein